MFAPTIGARPRVAARGTFSGVAVVLCTTVCVAFATAGGAARAQGTGPLAFEVPAWQGPGTRGFGTISDPTIQPFIAPGNAPGLGLSRAVDLRGNGKPDVFACHFVVPPNPIVSAPCRFFRPQADGTVIDITRALLGPGPLPSVVHPRGMIVADFNNDGRPDLFVAAHGYDAIPFPGEPNVLLLSNPDGTYTDHSAREFPQPEFSHSACAGDVNGDGNLDLFVGNQTPAGPYLLIGNGDGTFRRTQDGLPQPVVSEGPLSCAFADIDGDGAIDLLLGTRDSRLFDSFVLYGNAAGGFTHRPRQVIPLGPLGAGTQIFDFLPLDIDRDGRMDLVVTNTTAMAGFALQVLMNKGGGLLVDEAATRLTTSPTSVDAPACSFMLAADFNGDGWEDLYCDTHGWSDTSRPRLWLNNRNGTWTAVPPQSLPVQSMNGMLLPVDFDGDGRTDLLALGIDGSELPNVSYRSLLNRTPRTLPGAPLASAVIAGNGEAAMFFSPPLGHGIAPIGGYTATCGTGSSESNVSAAAPGGPIVVRGLANGKLHHCTVTATSAAGTGLASRALSTLPRDGLHTVLEFHHPVLDHYFITANPAEQIAVASGAAGAEWRMTGLRFNAGGPLPVCRFYGSVTPGPNSHFYTLDASECEALKNLALTTPATQKRWNFESNDFASAAPIFVAGGNTCSGGRIPVYRAYNNGFARGLDSNHRITTNLQAYQAQIAQGWSGEGVVMCAALGASAGAASPGPHPALQ